MTAVSVKNGALDTRSHPLLSHPRHPHVIAYQEAAPKNVNRCVSIKNIELRREGWLKLGDTRAFFTRAREPCSGLFDATRRHTFRGILDEFRTWINHRTSAGRRTQCVVQFVYALLWRRVFVGLCGRSIASALFVGQ